MIGGVDRRHPRLELFGGEPAVAGDGRAVRGFRGQGRVVQRPVAVDHQPRIGLSHDAGVQSLAERLPFRPGAKGLHLLEAVAQSAASPAPEARTKAAVEWFAAEFDALKAELAAGVTLARQLAVLGQPEREARVAELLKPLLAQAGVAVGGKKAGLFGSFSRMFKK